MKKLLLICALMLSFSSFANDKIAYITNELAVEGSYILCEKDLADLKLTSFLVGERVENEEVGKWVSIKLLEENEIGEVCAQLTLKHTTQINKKDF